MQLVNAPGKLVLPFANSGAKNTIPTESQIGIVAGAASLTDGFPPLTRTPIAAGGVPPSGVDMNGILFELSAILRWVNAGGGYVYDSAFASDANVNGYPKGARVLRTDGLGYWLNTVDANTADPETGGVGWVPDFTSGICAVTMTNANVTLTALQYGKPIINITGTLTANLNLILPTLDGSEWIVANNTSGAFTITTKTAAGTGVVVPQGASRILYCDGTNVMDAVSGFLTQAQFDNSIAVATTAFVQRALGSLSGFTTINTNITLTAAHAGRGCYFSAAAIATLPVANTVTAGTLIHFTSATTGVTSVARQSTDTIAASSGSSALTSLALLDGEDLILESNGNNQWIAVGGSARLKYAGGFGSALAASGYQKLPSGLIIQWANVTSNASAGAVTSATFPIAFPTACRSYSLIPGTTDTTASSAWVDGSGPSTTAIPIRCNKASINVNFIAIGN